MMMTATMTTIGEPSEYPWRQSSPRLVMTGGGGKLKSNPKQLFKGAAVELEDLSYDDSIRWKYAYFFETDLA